MFRIHSIAICVLILLGGAYYAPDASADYRFKIKNKGASGTYVSCAQQAEQEWVNGGEAITKECSTNQILALKEFPESSETYVTQILRSHNCGSADQRMCFAFNIGPPTSAETVCIVYGYQGHPQPAPGQIEASNPCM